MTNQSDKSPVFNYKYLPFMSSVCPVILADNQYSQSVEDIETHVRRLDAMLTSWKMVKKPILGDGNCCFRSVACSLITNHKAILDQDPLFFGAIGINDIASISEIELSTKLREATVKEWQSHSEEYEGFLTTSTVVEEAKLFFQSGHFNSDLGDTVLLALSNVLGLSIMVFSSIQSHSVINILPRKLKIAIPIHLAHLQYGQGHYDVALVAQDASACDHSGTQNPLSISPTVVHCSCGKNDKSDQPHCQPITTRYATTIK